MIYGRLGTGLSRPKTDTNARGPVPNSRTARERGWGACPLPLMNFLSFPPSFLAPFSYSSLIHLPRGNNRPRSLPPEWRVQLGKKRNLGHSTSPPLPCIRPNRPRKTARNGSQFLLSPNWRKKGKKKERKLLSLSLSFHSKCSSTSSNSPG